MPKAITLNFLNCFRLGIFDLVASNTTRAQNPAKVALPNATNSGLSSDTAMRVNGSVRLNIAIPINPISIPFVSYFTAKFQFQKRKWPHQGAINSFIVTNYFLDFGLIAKDK